jgi:hypothetical protein
MNHAFRSTWGALLWKEWRQQRLAALFLCVFSLAGYLGYCRTDKGDPDPTGWLALLLLSALCLAANSFAMEREDRTEAFIVSLPLPRWRLLAVKYPAVLVLAFLSLLPAALLLRPPLGTVFMSTWGSEVWRVLPPAVGILLFATWAVAMVAALASQGFGGIGALVGTMAFGLAELLLFRTVGFRSFTAKGMLAWHYRVGMIACWAMPHLWLLRTWAGRRPTRPSQRRFGTWGFLFLAVPLLYGAATFLYQRVWMSPQQWLREGDACEAIPSPDGRTVAVGVSHPSGCFGHASSTWLLDVDTGAMRRIGPRWRDSRLVTWSWGATCWSPDGAQLHVHTTTAVAFPGADLGVPWPGAQEQTLQVTRVGKTWAEQPLGTAPSGSRWLGDGTRAVFTSKEWEFTDERTGKASRCLHPDRKEPVDGKWWGSRKAWLDHAIAGVLIEEEAQGKRMARYWRSSPELTRAERRDYSLPAAMPPGGYSPTFSRDGKWLLLEGDGITQLQFWLLSLTDGDCRPLPLQQWRRIAYRAAFFTPDSQLLVIPGYDRLHTWDVPARSWRPEISLPPSAQARETPEGWTSTPVYAISPGRPWRVAVGIRRPAAVNVIDLAQRTAIRAFSQHHSQSKGTWIQRMSWLGNDRLLVMFQHPGWELWVGEADGSGSRQVLP